MYEEVGRNINPYGLDYPVCHEDGTSSSGSHSQSSTSANPHPRNKWQTMFSSSNQVSQLFDQTTSSAAQNAMDPSFLPPQDRYRPCSDEHLELYLNRLDVQRAIHVEEQEPPGSYYYWKACTTKVHYSRQDTTTPQIDLYRDLIHRIQHVNNRHSSSSTNHMSSHGTAATSSSSLSSFANANANANAIHILIYSGDDDSVCSLAGTQSWIWDLGVEPIAQERWKPWQVNDQTAGFVTRFHMVGGSSSSSSSSSTLTFVTVHGAGHEVPAYRPMEALEMLRNYLHGQW